MLHGSKVSSDEKNMVIDSFDRLFKGRHKPSVNKNHGSKFAVLKSANDMRTKKRLKWSLPFSIVMENAEVLYL